MSYIGAHISISKGLVNAAKEARSYGGNMLQIFTGSPRSRSKTPRDEDELKECKKYLEKNNMKIVIHSSYLLNLAKPWTEYSWWLKELEIELENAYHLGAIGVVIHMGKSLELSKEEAYNNMYTSLIHVLKNTTKFGTKIILETPAGQGTEMCHKLEEFAKFYNKFKSVKEEHKKRVGICIDSCHIFASGYNIGVKSDFAKYKKQFDKLIGFKHIDVIHLNDSKGELGCRVDRHENIGKGHIGKKGLVDFATFFRKKNIPIVLETPFGRYLKEIKMIS
jgi:deoxyribonuclease IV